MLDLGLGISSPATLGASSIYQSEAAALFSRMTVKPDDTRKGHLNTFIASLKTGGVWAKLDLLYVLAAHDSQAALLNWIAPPGNLTAVNAPTFTTDRGYTGNGTSSHLDSGIVWNTLVKFQQDNNLIFSYERTDVSGSASFSIGSTGATSRIRLIPRSGLNGLARTCANTAVNAALPVATSIGLTAAQRTGAAAEELFKDAVSFGTGTTASAAVPSDGNVALLRDNTSYSARQLSVAGIGASLSSGQHTALKNALDVLKTAIGF